MLTSKLFVHKTRRHSYAEVNQQNPLRWTIFYRNDNGQFVQQTKEFKCKDFFNDYVAKYRDIKFSMYGMPCPAVKVNNYGMWIGLTNTTPEFINNIERALNPKLEAETGHKLFPVSVEDSPGMVFFLLPRSLFDCTYTISFVTLIIRACNVHKELSCFDELITTSKEKLIENAQWLKEKSFVPPEHLRQYWWWQGEAYNDKKIASSNYAFKSFVHNNGIFAWVSARGFNPTV